MALTDDQKTLLSYGQAFFDPYLLYFSGQTQEAATSGSCGPNATWSFDSATGTLRISGEYQINDYVDNYSPWYNNGIEDSITAVVIEGALPWLAPMPSTVL